MKKLRKISSILIVMMLILSMGSVFAADSTITYNGKGFEDKFGFAPGSEYTDTDLFDGFRNVMPGDQLEEVITFTNEAKTCDKINVYMKAVAHDEEGNPLTYDEAFEDVDGKDQEHIDGQRDETVATMAEFLQQLTMRIYNGTELIFDGTPDEEGALADFVKLGELTKGKSIVLTVELDVPIELDNRFAHRVGEVDWVFMVEEIIEEAPDTGDNANLLIYGGIFAVSVAVLFVVVLKKKKNENV
ncbi:MAG: LPXTG cell wall anchor domain-containing protein [Anaerofustis stercorihominis]|nr:LPXTG cell wall anchor domain-containing protein [Anaerofustis stercorihominis]